MTASPDLQATARLALACLDLTSLNDADTEADVLTLCARAHGPFGDVAAVCVWPRFAALARRSLPAGIAVAAVANFPHGGDDVERAVADTRAIAAAGAQEVDVVLPFAALQRGDEPAVVALLAAVRAACPGLLLKVILETGVLTDTALIARAARLSLDAGADFLKTSTGKTPVSATIEAAGAMLATIAADPIAATRVGFKASGGIRSVADAGLYLALTEHRLGRDALGPRRFRIGASSLLNDIEAVLGGSELPAGGARRLLKKPVLAQEIIRRKRDGQVLDGAAIDAFVRGLVDASWSEAQAAAMAMAMFVNGLDAAETLALTHAMTRSGELLDWSASHLHGPVLDKHSTGGVGDKVSLLLAPIVAAAGGIVPMISGRGLGHTGGTLDKFDSIPGYRTQPSIETLRGALRAAGCAIVGQTAALAPADRRLYAIRDVTATVESIPLITASILSKKLAAGLQGLVMDVKTGNGAFAAARPMAQALARSLVQVAEGAGLPTRAWITDMSQVLGHSCGNAVEVHEALAFLRGDRREPRLLEVTRTLSAELLVLGRLAPGPAAALAKVDAVLADGSALDRFARMVAALGGPVDVVERAASLLPVAPVQRAVGAPRAGWIAGMATREIGWVVVELGGGRRRADDAVDHRVGLTEVVATGCEVAAGEPLAVVHAADEASAEAACARLARLFEIADAPPAPMPVMIERLSEPATSDSPPTATGRPA